MIHIGSLVPGARVEVIDALVGDLSECVATPCMGVGAIFGAGPVSVCLNDAAPNDPTFSVTSKVLSADAH